MRSRKLNRRTLFVVLAIGIAGSFVVIANQAEAQRGAREFYYDSYDTDRRGARGYEGFRFPGSYCSYRRYPRRVCTYDKRGRETCRVQGWRVEQTCD